MAEGSITSDVYMGETGTILYLIVQAGLWFYTTSISCGATMTGVQLFTRKNSARQQKGKTIKKVSSNAKKQTGKVSTRVTFI